MPIGRTNRIQNQILSNGNVYGRTIKKRSGLKINCDKTEYFRDFSENLEMNGKYQTV